MTDTTYNQLAIDIANKLLTLSNNIINTADVNQQDSKKYHNICIELQNQLIKITTQLSDKLKPVIPPHECRFIYNYATQERWCCTSGCDK